MNIIPENITIVSHILTFLNIIHTNTKTKIITESNITPFTKTTLDYTSAKHLWNNFTNIIVFFRKTASHNLTIL